MTGFRSIADYAESVESGRHRITSWRKSPSQAPGVGSWFDLSMSPGNPVPNYYASSPAVSAVLNGNEGIFHGGPVSPAKKRIKRLLVLATAVTALPLPMIMLDYLLYYPFLDMGTNDDQPLTNSLTLPRYADGKGVQVMAVLTNPLVTGGPYFNFTYTNQDGVAGRTSPPVRSTGNTAIGGLVNTTRASLDSSSAFLPLADGDTGVRSIETFRMTSGSDVGLICLVLVKPLATTIVRGIDAVNEVDYLSDYPSLPIVEDGAYLNYICNAQGTLSATALHGLAEFTWR
jgi:hypothetical protein